MREIKVTTPEPLAEGVARMAKDLGIDSITVSEQTVYGVSTPYREVKLRTSTPAGKKFLDRLFSSAVFDRSKFIVSSHELRAVVSAEEMKDVTRPLIVPMVDVFEDLWQNSHLTRTFFAKVVGSALLLAYAMLKNNIVLMIGALLFTPFTPLLMGFAFGLRAGDRGLIKQSMKAFFVGTLLTVAAAAVVTAAQKGPLGYQEFGSVGSNFFQSLAAGAIAGFADADDVGRRQLIGLAAAYPYVKFPVWFGYSLVEGFSGGPPPLTCAASFAVDVVTIIVVTWVIYRTLGLERRALGHFIPKR
jgi:hypothetical protein